MNVRKRRQHQRYRFRHDVLVVTPGVNPAACELANLCEGGMWLENVSSAKLIDRLLDHPESPVEVHLFIDRPDQEVHTRVKARVRRIDDTNMGVEFLRPMPDLLAMLVEGEASRPRNVFMDEGERVRLWQVFLERVSRFLHPLLDSFVEHSLEGIQTRLRKASINREVNDLRQSQMMLVEGRDRLTNDFLVRWQSMREAIQGKSGTRRNRQDLDIVDKALFEDWLELQMVATGLASNHRNRLFGLNQMLSQLSLTDLDERSNPLAPIPLCQCLQFAVFRAGFPDAVKPILYRAFELALKAHWPDSMDQLMDSMRAGGLRTLDLESMPSVWNETPERDRKLEINNRENRDFREATPVEPGSVLRLVGLLKDPRRPNIPETAALARLADRLQPLREELRQALSDGTPGLTDALKREVAHNEALEQEMGSDGWDLVKLVDQLFAPLSRLKNLPDNLRQHLDQLRLPVLQVLLDNPDFLDDDDHPARQVVNHLMRLCMADRGSSKNLERTVISVVDQLFTADELDGRLLTRVAERLQVLVERQEKAFLRNAERIAKTFEGRQRLEHARRAIRRRINMRLAGREVPLSLLDLLSVGWEQLMVLAVLKEGGDSQTLAELFSVVDQIQTWLGREGDSEELAFERELESPALLELIERELVATGEPGRAKVVLRRLQSQLMDESRPDHVWLASYPLGEEPSDAGTPDTAPEDSRWATRASRLQVGDWVSVRNADGESQRMRLVWAGW